MPTKTAIKLNVFVSSNPVILWRWQQSGWIMFSMWDIHKRKNTIYQAEDLICIFFFEFSWYILLKMGMHNLHYGVISFFDKHNKDKAKQAVRRNHECKRQTGNTFYSLFLSKSFIMLMWIKYQKSHSENLKGNFRPTNLIKC